MKKSCFTSQTAKSLLKALNHFFTLYPRFKNAEFYLSGESYAGIYLPMLADEIIKENGTIAKNLKVQFKNNL